MKDTVFVIMQKFQYRQGTVVVTVYRDAKTADEHVNRVADSGAHVWAREHVVHTELTLPKQMEKP